MSHELRTPLNVIIGYSDLLIDQTFGELAPDQRETVRRIAAQGRELLELVNTTLDMSRLEAGRVPLAVQEVDLVDLLGDIEREAQLVQRTAAVEMRWEVAGAVPRFFTDPVKLKVVIKNLVLNAIKFTDEGSVAVRAGARDQRRRDRRLRQWHRHRAGDDSASVRRLPAGRPRRQAPRRGRARAPHRAARARHPRRHHRSGERRAARLDIPRLGAVAGGGAGGTRRCARSARCRRR